MRLAFLSLLLLFTAWVSGTAHDHDGRETPAVAAGKGGLNTVEELATVANLISDRNGGRKMLVEQKVEKGDGMDAVEKAAGSKHLGRKCDHHVMKGSRVDCKNNHFSVDDVDEDAGFEVLTRDYHLPSHHPPKNN